MMANNWQRLNIWLELTNRFSYADFSYACHAAGIEPQEPLEFAQKAGMASSGMAAYTGLPAAEAYLKFIRENRPVYVPPPQESKGLGDTVAKITHATGLDKLATLYTSITGRPCGCTSRQEALNKLIPYGIKET